MGYKGCLSVLSHLRKWGSFPSQTEEVGRNPVCSHLEDAEVCLQLKLEGRLEGTTERHTQGLKKEEGTSVHSMGKRKAYSHRIWG